MGEALATRQSNCTTASTKSHVHLRNVSGSTPQANEQRVFCPVYSFKNIRAQRRCSNLPSLGKRSIVTNINHSEEDFNSTTKEMLDLHILCSYRSLFVRMVIPYLPCSPCGCHHHHLPSCSCSCVSVPTKKQFAEHKGATNGWIMLQSCWHNV